MTTRYLLSIVIAASVINVTLAFVGADDVTLYFTLDTIAFFVITTLFVHFHPRTRAVLSKMAVVFFIGVVSVAILKALEALARLK